MKKILLFPFFIIFAVSVFAQGTIKNATYINFAWTNPVMNYGERTDVNSSENLKNFYKNQHQDVKPYGGSLEVGTTFYIHPTGIFDGFKAGVLWDFIDLNTNYFNFKDSSITLANPKNLTQEESCHDLTVRYSMNFGALLTYSPAKNVYFDLYAKIRPTFAVNYYNMPQYDGVYDKVYSNYTDAVLATKHKPKVEDTGIGFGFNSSYGINMRVSKVLVGFEWALGKISYSYDGLMDKQQVYDQFYKLKLGLFFID